MPVNLKRFFRWMAASITGKNTDGLGEHWQSALDDARSLHDNLRALSEKAPEIIQKLEASMTAAAKIRAAAHLPVNNKTSLFAPFASKPFFQAEDAVNESMISCLMDMEWLFSIEGKTSGGKIYLRKFGELFIHSIMIAANEDYIKKLPFLPQHAEEAAAIRLAYLKARQSTNARQADFNNYFTRFMNVLTIADSNEFSPAIPETMRMIANECSDVHFQLRKTHFKTNEELTQIAVRLSEWFDAHFGDLPVPDFDAQFQAKPVPIRAIVAVAQQTTRPRSGFGNAAIAAALSDALPTPAKTAILPTPLPTPEKRIEAAQSAPPVFSADKFLRTTRRFSNDFPELLKGWKNANYLTWGSVVDALVTAGWDRDNAQELLRHITRSKTGTHLVERQNDTVLPAPFGEALARLAGKPATEIFATLIVSEQKRLGLTAQAAAKPVTDDEAAQGPENPPPPDSSKEEGLKTTDTTAAAEEVLAPKGRVVLSLGELVEKLENNIDAPEKEDEIRETLRLLKPRSRGHTVEREWAHIETVGDLLMKNHNGYAADFIEAFYTLLKDKIRVTREDIPEPHRTNIVNIISTVARIDENETGAIAADNSEIRDLMRSKLGEKEAERLGLIRTWMTSPSSNGAGKPSNGANNSRPSGDKREIGDWLPAIGTIVEVHERLFRPSENGLFETNFTNQEMQHEVEELVSKAGDIFDGIKRGLPGYDRSVPAKRLEGNEKQALMALVRLNYPSVENADAKKCLDDYAQRLVKAVTAILHSNSNIAAGGFGKTLSGSAASLRKVISDKTFLNRHLGYWTNATNTRQNTPRSETWGQPR